MSKLSTFTRSLSTSNKNFFPKKRPKYLYPQLDQSKAQKNFDRKKHKEILIAQKKRNFWEYPVQADQRTTWKHRRWYDVFFNKWVSTLPKPPRTFTVNYKDQREFVFKAETPDELFKLLLDSYVRKKYVVSSLDHETPISNISYYYQYLTNTKYIHGLPISIENAAVDENYLKKFRSFVQDVFLNEHSNSESIGEDDPAKRSAKISSSILKSIMQYLVATLSPENSNLSQLEVDHNVENSMFWFRGTGFIKWTLPDDHPFAFQCHDPVLMQIRTKEELPAFSPREGTFSTSGEIPSFFTSPHVFKVVPFVQYRNTISPGYKLFAGDCNQNYQYAKDEDLLHELPPPTYNECKYGHTQLLQLPETYSRDWYKENLEHCDITGEIEEHLKGRGLMSGWVWTAAQAHYQQYWMDKDIEKPFSSQSIVTDSQWMSFFCYQLNTISIDADNVEENNKRNLCFGRTSVKLYEEVTENNEVVGLNDEALILLIKFLQNGVRQHQSVVASDDQIEEYNAKLTVQEADPEKPDIELQKPPHKAEMDRIRAEEKKASEEKEAKNKSFLTKIKDAVKMSLP